MRHVWVAWLWLADELRPCERDAAKGKSDFFFFFFSFFIKTRRAEQPKVRVDGPPT